MIKTFWAVVCLCLFPLLLSTGCAPSPPRLRQVLYVSVRSSLLSPGTAVLQLSNAGSQPLRKVTIYFRNRDSNQQTHYTIAELQPSQVREIGILETGWALEPNEELTLTAEGFTGFRAETYRADNGKVGIRAPWW